MTQRPHRPRPFDPFYERHRARAYGLHVSVWSAAWLVAPPESNAEGWCLIAALAMWALFLSQLWLLREVRWSGSWLERPKP